jgi:hypothetical protein
LDIGSADRQALSADIAALFNRTNRLDDEGGVIAADVDELHDRVAALEEATHPKVEPPSPFVVDPCGLLRHAGTGKGVARDSEAYQNWLRLSCGSAT